MRPTVADLSPAAQAIWEAFNATAERVGTFEDYGDALAAALRATANAIGLLPIDAVALTIEDMTEQRIRRDLLALATELKSHQ